MKKPTSQRVDLLNKGLDQATNLMEALAVDFNALFKHVFPELPLATIEKKLGIVKRMQQAAAFVQAQIGTNVLPYMINHTSDTLRGVAAYVIASQGDSLKIMLKKIQPLVEDENAGVREWAWLAVRPHLHNDLPKAITLLKPWAKSDSERLRRFASEVTRPRGVWCAHLKELQAHPELALSLLEPLKADPSLYVRKSVGNWLSDAHVQRPGWVHTVCKTWAEESSAKETTYIINRALRNCEHQR